MYMCVYIYIYMLIIMIVIINRGSQTHVQVHRIMSRSVVSPPFFSGEIQSPRA